MRKSGHMHGEIDPRIDFGDVLAREKLRRSMLHEGLQRENDGLNVSAGHAVGQTASVWQKTAWFRLKRNHGVAFGGDGFHGEGQIVSINVVRVDSQFFTGRGDADFARL